MNTHRSLIRVGSIFLIVLVLAACAATPPQTPLENVAQQLAQTHPGIELTSTATELSDEPLDLSAALRTMLSRSPQVRIELAQLGIADAQRLQTELISNPHLSIGALKPEDGGRWKLDVGLSQPLLELFTRPLRRELAAENLLVVQQRLQSRLQTLLAQTSDAYYRAIAAQQHVQVQQQMLDATLARQQLAHSLYNAGNISENSFLYYDNELRRMQRQLKKREHKARESYLDLISLMGFNSQQAVKLPTQLAKLPDERFSYSELLTQARTTRLDLKIARQQLSQLKHRAALVRARNGWRDVNIGVNAEREFDGATNVGPEIEFAVPLFNRNQGKLAAITAQTAEAQAQLDQIMLTADIEIAQALDQMQSAREQLILISASLQVAKQRVTLSSREINFMLGSPFELLSIKRQEIQFAHDYTSELANYWRARTTLELALGRALPLTTGEIEAAKLDDKNLDHRKEMDHTEMNQTEINLHKTKHNGHEGHHHD